MWCMDAKYSNTIPMKLASTCSLVRYEVTYKVSSKCVEPEKMKSEIENYHNYCICDSSDENFREANF